MCEPYTFAENFLFLFILTFLIKNNRWNFQKSGRCFIVDKLHGTCKFCILVKIDNGKIAHELISRWRASTYFRTTFSHNMGACFGDTIVSNAVFWFIIFKKFGIVSMRFSTGKTSEGYNIQTRWDYSWQYEICVCNYSWNINRFATNLLKVINTLTV